MPFMVTTNETYSKMVTVKIVLQLQKTSQKITF